MSGAVPVALDIQALQVDGFADRGIGRYVAGYSAALARSGRLAAALLAPELPPPSGLPGELVERDVLRWDGRATARRIIDSRPDVAYHVTAPFLHCGPLDSPVLGVAPHWAEAARPRVILLHDLIPLRAPRHYLPTDGHEQRYRERARWVGESELILTNSDFTRTEAIELLGCRPDRVVTAGAGVSGYFSPPDGTDDELWELHFGHLAGRSFLLTVGGSDPRKGTERAIAALGRLVGRDRDLHLLVVGELTPEWQDNLSRAARAHGVADRVILTGKVNDELLRAAYRRAAATLMPSLAEGAGLPVLESAASGTPALASNSSALAETAASPLAVFDPNDTESMVGVIAALLDEPARRLAVLSAQQELARISTWDAVAARAGQAIDELVLPVPTKGSRLARAVALVGPVPPDGGGIGAYNGRLLSAAASSRATRFDAVWTATTRPAIADGVGYVSSDAFGIDIRPASYDQVVYSLGNSGGHLVTVGLALRHPGWLWLHEARLPGIATTALAGLDDPSFESAMAGLVARAYPGRAPLGSARRAGRSHLDLVEAGVGLIGPLAERCAGILVNSELARRMVLLDLPPGSAPPPVRVLPPGCPPLRSRPAVAAGEPVVVAFGVVSMSKRPDLLVDAAALSGLRVVFVGPCPDILGQFLEHRAHVRGAAGLVDVVGEVDQAGWDDWLDRATLAVQLRGSVTGETSAAVLEALSSGVPVLTNVATTAEYPAGTVAYVRQPTAEGLAGAISDLISSPAEMARLGQAGQEFAAANQFGALLDALLATTAAE